MNARIRDAIDLAVSYVQKDARISIVLVALLVGFVIWLADAGAGLLDRRVPLHARQRSRLALAAPYFTVHSFREGDLVGKRPLGRLWMRRLLRKDWGIRDQATAVERLEDLVHYGHRSDPRFQDPTQPREDQALVDRAMLAWDAIRLPWLARCCYTSGFVDEVTVWHYADAGAALARSRFGGWEEWGRAFLDGRVLWGGDARSYYEVVVKKLLEDPKSVWNRVSWHRQPSPNASSGAHSTGPAGGGALPGI